MRKRIVAPHGVEAREGDHRWLDLEHLATVEVTSEHPSFPVESALALREGPGWRAAQHGQQQIRIIFDEPVSLQRIQLRFCEAESERTQEFTVRWSSAGGGPSKEIVCQQWNFSRTGSTTEIEDYTVDLQAVAVLELTIQPDVSGREAIATLASWRLG
jgi:hypothetical protein